MSSAPNRGGAMILILGSSRVRSASASADLTVFSTASVASAAKPGPWPAAMKPLSEGNRLRETKIAFDAEAKKASYLERDRARNNAIVLSQETDIQIGRASLLE